MRARNYAIALILIFFMSPLTICQESSGGHFRTFKQLLKERNIELSEPGLVAALQNIDFHVRYLAALVLAQDKTHDSIPAIEDALAREKVPEARVNIAFALAQLGEEKGFEALRDSCEGPNSAPQFRIFAAKYLLDLGRTACLNAVIEVVKSHADLSNRVMAMSLLHRFQRLSPKDSQRISDACLGALADPQPEARVAASGALARLSAIAAIPQMQHAVETEQDEWVRSRLQADLLALQAKVQP